MVRVTRLVPTLLVVFALMAGVAGCKQQSSGSGFGWKPLFGDLTKDNSPVVAQVGDVAITQVNLEQFIAAQPDRLKNDFAGPEGERVALRRMIEQTLMVFGAVERKLYNDKDVAQSLVMQRRLTLDRAMRQYGLLRGAKPTEAQLREYYEKNSESYRQQGMVRARHIECLTKADADRAYKRLQTKELKDDWVHVCDEVSINEETKKLAGDAGWMSAGTAVPLIDGGMEFSTAVFNLPIGVNAPLQIGDRWHVVEISHRQFERKSKFEEAKDAVETEMMPGFQDAIIKDYLKSAREKYGVKMLGRFTPGEGMTPQQIFERAMLNPDILRRIDLLSMIAEDFPESDRADDALFMAGNTAIENLADLSVGIRIFESLIELYPESELVDDTKYILENIYNPKFRKPASIEDLKR
jgi:parvulin-like peptidyl-prolyl isomerase